MRIAVAGKGGSGKTTLAALIIIHLKGTGRKPILAVDADPNYCLGEYLGVKEFTPLMEKAEELLKLKDRLPPGMDKTLLWEMGLEEIIAEREGFDLLVMGKTEGPGCYCSANNLLRLLLEKLARSYPYTVIDNEAGMEHLSRRTSGELDHLLIVANPHPLSLRSAQRIKELSEKLEINIRSKHLVILHNTPTSSPFTPFQPPLVEIPYDKKLVELSLSGTPLTQLPSSTPILHAVENLVDKLLSS